MINHMARPIDQIYNINAILNLFSFFLTSNKPNIYRRVSVSFLYYLLTNYKALNHITIIPHDDNECTQKCWQIYCCRSNRRFAIHSAKGYRIWSWPPAPQDWNPPSSRNYPKLSKKRRGLGEIGGGKSSGAACQCQVVWHLGRPSKNVADITVPTTKWCCVVCGWLLRWLRWFHWFW